MLIVQAAAVPGPPASDPLTACRDAAQPALDAARQLVLRGDDAGAQRELEAEALRIDERCPILQLAAIALSGWQEARALAPKGGARELLDPVTKAAEALAPFKELPDLRLEAEYAEAALRAAVAAAQDERPEMELLLGHLRDLAERLAARGQRPQWPRSFNLLDGELWFEVDRYETARLAFARAAQDEPSPLALVGLARAEARLGRREEACATLRRAGLASVRLLELAAREIPRCR